jgi:AcrR family transcriptional regulator
MTTSKKPVDRRTSILNAAMRMSRVYGYQKTTRKDVAGAAHCSEGLVSAYFGTMTQLRRAVVRAAIDQKDLAILAQAIAAHDKHAAKIPDGLRIAALVSLA